MFKNAGSIYIWGFCSLEEILEAFGDIWLFIQHNFLWFDMVTRAWTSEFKQCYRGGILERFETWVQLSKTEKRITKRTLFCFVKPVSDYSSRSVTPLFAFPINLKQLFLATRRQKITFSLKNPQKLILSLFYGQSVEQGLEIPDMCGV